MLELQLLSDKDIPLVEGWLNKAHVKRWYEIPSMGITIDDWISEIKEYQDKMSWITYLIVLWEEQPIGMCLFYRCEDSDEEFGTFSKENAYGIDYLIGEESFLRRGIGKQMIQELVERIWAKDNAKKVTAEVDAENIASKNVLLSCGFSIWEQGNGRVRLYLEDKYSDKE